MKSILTLVATGLALLALGIAFIVALAVMGLLLAGWRKPARASVRRPRGPFGGYIGVPITQEPTTLHRRPGPLRRELGRDVHHAPLEEKLAGADAVPESRDPVGRRRVRNAGGES